LNPINRFLSLLPIEFPALKPESIRAHTTRISAIFPTVQSTAAKICGILPNLPQMIQTSVACYHRLRTYIYKPLPVLLLLLTTNPAPMVREGPPRL